MNINIKAMKYANEFEYTFKFRFNVKYSSINENKSNMKYESTLEFFKSFAKIHIIVFIF